MGSAAFYPSRLPPLFSPRRVIGDPDHIDDLNMTTAAASAAPPSTLVASANGADASRLIVAEFARSWSPTVSMAPSGAGAGADVTSNISPTDVPTSATTDGELLRQFHHHFLPEVALLLPLLRRLWSATKVPPILAEVMMSCGASYIGAHNVAVAKQHRAAAMVRAAISAGTWDAGAWWLVAVALCWCWRDHWAHAAGARYLDIAWRLLCHKNHAYLEEDQAVVEAFAYCYTCTLSWWPLAAIAEVALPAPATVFGEARRWLDGRPQPLPLVFVAYEALALVAWTVSLAPTAGSWNDLAHHLRALEHAGIATQHQLDQLKVREYKRYRELRAQLALMMVIISAGAIIVAKIQNLTLALVLEPIQRWLGLILRELVHETCHGIPPMCLLVAGLATTNPYQRSLILHSEQVAGRTKRYLQRCWKHNKPCFDLLLHWERNDIDRL